MSDSSGCGKEISCTDYYISIKIESGRRTNIGAATLIYAGNEPKSVLARDLGDCRDNLRNSRSVFLIV